MLNLKRPSAKLFLVDLFLSVGLLFWLGLATKYDFRIYAQSQTTATLQATETFSPKVYLLIFNPVLTAKNNTPLIAYEKWNNPYTLAQQYIDEVKEVSHGIINYKIVTQLEASSIPLKQDGFSYTEQSYLDCIEGRSPCHNQTPDADFANYNKILSDYNICSLVNSGEIDELWMFGAPWFGFYEANMAGGGFWTNGPVINGTSCQKPLHIMGFSYAVGIDMMLHDLGHRAEGTFDHFLGVQKNSTGMGWGDFRLSKGNNPNVAIYGCGDIHFPPNATSSYQYDSTFPVFSRCEDWLNYPNFTGKIQSTNCNNWSCSSQVQLNYFKWWFKHLPYAEGIDSNGKKINWWFYITNVISDVIPTPTTVNPTVTPTITPTQFILPTVRRLENILPTLRMPTIVVPTTGMDISSFRYARPTPRILF